jgi:hypothetical protein
MLKLTEYKDNTTHAMIPEYQRLDQLYQKELNSMELNHKLSENEMKSELLQKFYSDIERNKSSKENLIIDRKNEIHQKHKTEADNMEMKHQLSKQALRNDLEKKMEELQISLSLRNEKEHHQHQQLLLTVQNETSSNLENEKRHLSQEVLNMKKSHDDQV